jgi:hypothetical protein
MGCCSIRRTEQVPCSIARNVSLVVFNRPENTITKASLVIISTVLLVAMPSLFNNWLVLHGQLNYDPGFTGLDEGVGLSGIYILMTHPLPDQLWIVISPLSINTRSFMPTRPHDCPAMQTLKSATESPTSSRQVLPSRPNCHLWRWGTHKRTGGKWSPQARTTRHHIRALIRPDSKK